MNTKRIQVLQIEDNPDDAFLIKTMIQDQGQEREQEHQIALSTEANLTDGLAYLGREAVDVVLLDLGLPESSGIATLELFRQKAPSVTVIILTGFDDDSFALNAVQTGADDYLVKGNISPETLIRAIHYAYGRKASAKALTESNVRFSAVIQSASDAVLIIDGQGNIVSSNRSAKKMFGYSEAEMDGHPFQMIIPEGYWKEHAEGLQRLLHGGTPHKMGRTVEMQALRRDQTEFPVELSLTSWQVESDQYYSAFIRDISERKESEKALVESQRQLSTLMDNLPGMAYRRKNDPNWSTGFVSDGCLGLTGYPPGSLIHNSKISYLELIHPEDIEMVTESIQGQLQINQPFKITYRLITPTEGEKWVWEQGRGIPSKDGQVMFIEGFITDISDRVQAENAVRQSREHYHGLFEGVPIGLYRTSVDGTILDINRALIEMVGFPDRESAVSYIATNVYVDPADRAIWQERMDRDGVVKNFETRWWKQDGEIIWVEESAHIVKDVSGQTLYYEGSAVDVTERKQAELAQQASETKYRVLFENMMDGFSLYEIIFDDEGRPVDYLYLDGNQAFEDLTGLKVADTIGRRFSEVLSSIEQDPRDWLGKYHKVALTGEKIRFEQFVESLDKWYSINAFSPRKGQLATIFQDITANKNFEALLQGNLARMRSLHEIDKALTSTLDLPGVLSLILTELTKIVRCDSVSLQMVRDNHSEIVACHGFENPDEVIGLVFPIDRKYPNYAVIREGKTLAYDDIAQTYSHFQLEGDKFTSGSIHSWLGVPLIVDQEVIGMLAIDRYEIRPFGSEIIEITTRFAAQAALALHNAQLYKILLESEAGYRNIFEGIQDAILVEGLEGDILDVNTRATELYGYSRDDFLKKKVQDLFVDESPVFLLKDILSTERAPGTFETVNLRSDGTQMPVELTLRQGEIGGEYVQLAVVRDITSRKQAENLIQNQINRLEALRKIDLAIVGLTDLESTLNMFIEQLLGQLEVDTACILLRNTTNGKLEFAAGDGFRTEALQYTSLAIGEGNAGLAARDKKPVFIEDLESQGTYFAASTEFAAEGFQSYYAVPLFIREEVIGVIEIFHRSRLDPNPNWVQFLAMLATHAAIAIDNARLFTKLQENNIALEGAVDEATQELRQSNRRLEVILNNSPDTVLLLTPEGLIERANDAIQLQFDYEPREVEGRQMDTLLAGNAGTELKKPIEELLQSPVPISWEANAARRDGTSFEAEFVLAPIRYNMNVNAFVCTIRDISDWKELERLKDGFVSNVSHELRTPITSLRLNYSLLKKNPENLDKYLGRFDREIERLNVLIEDLLRLSRLDQGQIQLNLDVVELDQLIEETIQDRVPMAEANQLEIKFVPDREVPAVNADAGLLGQVLNVLVTNSIHYTPAGGHIEVRQVQGDLENFTWAGFSVEDDGPGISPEDLPHLFERFYRGKVGRDSGAPGTGLGLAIAHEIVLRHQGQMDVESPGVPGQGTIFTVKLPLVDNLGEHEK